MTKPLKATCHCGGVQIFAARRPDYLNECNCRLCSSHGVWWGYFDPEDVLINGETRAYSRADKPDPTVHIHFCANCGCTTHFVPTPRFVEKTGVTDVRGINMRLFALTDLSGLELRYPDGARWDGIGQWDFVRQAEILT
jgi:hypothetical protein